MVKTVRVQNLCCANCAAKIERKIGKLDAVNSASVSVFTQKITIDMRDGSEQAVMDEVHKICKKVEPDMVLLG